MQRGELPQSAQLISSLSLKGKTRQTADKSEVTEGFNQLAPGSLTLSSSQSLFFCNRCCLQSKTSNLEVPNQQRLQMAHLVDISMN